jgi:hypothetical protein
MTDEQYDQLIEGVEDNSYNHDTEFQMIVRGKHYDEDQTVNAIKALIRGLMHQASTLESLLK